MNRRTAGIVVTVAIAFAGLAGAAHAQNSSGSAAIDASLRAAVDRKDVPGIAREIERLSAAARAGKVRREELKGGTFTVTSVGSIGGLFSTPVINHPEVGILGLGKVVKRPVFDERDQVKAAHVLYLSFSFDHRVVDGAVGAHFSNVVIRNLQRPAVLLLPG